MLQKMIDQPWASVLMLVTIVILCIAAVVRSRLDSRLKVRALIDRRKSSRLSLDRRWYPSWHPGRNQRKVRSRH